MGITSQEYRAANEQASARAVVGAVVVLVPFVAVETGAVAAVTSAVPQIKAGAAIVLQLAALSTAPVTKNIVKNAAEVTMRRVVKKIAEKSAVPKKPTAGKPPPPPPPKLKE